MCYVFIKSFFVSYLTNYLMHIFHLLKFCQYKLIKFQQVRNVRFS